jgi:hypothetical protein
MKPVILGMNAPNGGNILHPAIGSGRRLFEATGFFLADYLSTFVRINLLDLPEWDAGSAKARSAWFKGAYAGRRIVVLGSPPWIALSLPKKDLFEWHHSEDGTSWAMVPHTSGKNLWWNAEENKERARAFFATFKRSE